MKNKSPKSKGHISNLLRDNPIVLAVGALTALTASWMLPALADGATTYTFPITNEATTNPCNGEAIILNGETKMLVRFTVDSKGAIHYGVNIDEHGTGVTAVPTVQYVFSERHFEEGNTNFRQDGSFEITVAYDRRLISSTAPDFQERMLTHITVNANGVPTVIFSRMSSECRV